MASIDSKLQCTLKLATLKKPIVRVESNFVVDSGADISTMTKELYKQNFSNLPLVASEVELINFDGSKVEKPIGKIKLLVHFRKNKSVITFHIVTNKCFSVLGLSDMAKLHMKVDTAQHSVFTIKSSPTPEKLLDSLVKEFPKLFSSGIGKIPNFQHKILLKPNSKPKQQKLRHPPIAMRQAAKEDLDSLLEEDIIEQIVKSEYVHPVHFVWKPDKTIRTTVDFSKGLNEDIIPSIHPLPLPEDIFSRVTEDRFFSKLDISKAYFHLELAPESRPLTAFITESHGLCQFKRVPMGLTDSGAACQKWIENALAGLPGVDCYIDDIFIRGRNRVEHDARLKATLERLQSNNIRLKRPKLLIATQKVPFLGHLIIATDSGTTIQPDPKNSQSIRDLRTPTDIHGVRQFLGCCNYYSQYIRSYANLTEPLHNLTRKNVHWDWSEKCQISFDTLKNRIASPEVLVPFNPNFPTFLTTDASDVGLGAILSQLQGGNDRPIAFASKTLSMAERNYSAPEREALACTWACEHFDKYLLGRKFTLRTDQSSLQALLKRFGENRTSRRISRWYDRLRHFEYDVIHIKGKENAGADMLSRLGTQPTPSASATLQNDDDTIIIAPITLDSSVTVDQFIDASSKDTDFHKIQSWLSTDWPTRKLVPEHLRSFYDIRNELSCVQSCLYRGERLIVPESLRPRILQLLHSGHPGVTRMRQKLNDSYFWPGGSRDVEYFVRNCTACAASGKSGKSEPVPTTAIRPPTRPWQKLAIDITGPFHTAPNHQRYIVALCDYFSKFPEILLTGDITSKKIIDWLQEIFSRFGNPEEIVSDNGPQFIGHEFTNFLRAKNIRHVLSCVYNPAQNGLIEVFNRSLKYGAQIINSENSNFKYGMLDLLTSFRSTAPEHGKSPSELLLGWKIRSDSDIRNPSLFREGETIVKSSHPDTQQVSQRVISMEERNKIVQNKFDKRRYGKGRTPEPKSPYYLGQMVRYKRPHTTVLKGQSPWSEPLQIVQVIGRWCYKLSDGQVWNARRLSRYRPEPTLESIEEEFFSENRISVPHMQPRSQRIRRAPDRYSPPPFNRARKTQRRK